MYLHRDSYEGFFVHVKSVELAEDRADILEDALAAAATAVSIAEVDASERDVDASPHDVEDGMGPRLKSFAVESAGVASRISEALRTRPQSFS